MSNRNLATMCTYNLRKSTEALKAGKHWLAKKYQDKAKACWDKLGVYEVNNKASKESRNQSYLRLR